MTTPNSPIFPSLRSVRDRSFGSQSALSPQTAEGGGSDAANIINSSPTGTSTFQRPRLRPVQPGIVSAPTADETSPNTVCDSLKRPKAGRPSISDQDKHYQHLAQTQSSANNADNSSTSSDQQPAAENTTFQRPKLRPVQRGSQSSSSDQRRPSSAKGGDGGVPSILSLSRSTTSDSVASSSGGDAGESPAFQRTRLRPVQSRQQSPQSSLRGGPTPSDTVQQQSAGSGEKGDAFQRPTRRSFQQSSSVPSAASAEESPAPATGSVETPAGASEEQNSDSPPRDSEKVTQKNNEQSVNPDDDNGSTGSPIDLSLDNQDKIIPHFSLELTPSAVDESSKSGAGTESGAEPSNNDSLGVRHVNDLKRLLRLNYQTLSSEDSKKKYRQFLIDFNGYYRNMQNYALNWGLSQPDAELLDLLFGAISKLDEIHECTDVILQTHTIVSRGAKRNSGGLEKRSELLMQLIQHQYDRLSVAENNVAQPHGDGSEDGNSTAVLKEAVKAMVNYSELNGRAVLEAGLIDTLGKIIGSAINKQGNDVEAAAAADTPNTVGPFARDSQLLMNCIWMIQNMCSSETSRQQVWEKVNNALFSLLCARTSDASICERLYWVFGNINMDEKLRASFAETPAITLVKSALETHADKERTVEAICWFLQNASFNEANAKALQTQSLDTVILSAARKFISGSPNIKVWAESAINSLKAAQAHANGDGAQNSNQQHSQQQQPPNVGSIMDRYNNRVERSGPLSVVTHSFFRKKVNKRHAILQHGLLMYLKSESDTEVDGYIDFKRVRDIIGSQDSNEIEIITDTGKSYLLALDSTSARQWVTSMRQFWRDTVNPIVEYPKSFLYSSGSAFGMIALSSFLSSVETVEREAVHRLAVMHALHEIFCNPYFLCVPFRCQKTFPNVSVPDYFAVCTAKKISKTFITNELASCKSTQDGDEDVYVVDQIKAAISRLIEHNIVKEMAAFEDAPTAAQAPLISTRYEFCAKQGLRPGMEDRHVHIPYMDLLLDRSTTDNPISYYAVYDGHGGISTADFVETNLHFNIIQHPKFEEDPKTAISEAFMSTQEALKKHSERMLQSTTAGSTAVVALIKGKQLYMAWAGDSLASLYMADGTIHELVDPHKPGKPSEKERIEKLGGFVKEEAGGVLRVNSAVAVSRAFGNIRHKVIIPEADIRVLELTGQEAFLVLACDGLWDVMQPQEVRQFVAIFLNQNGRRLKGISEALVEEALRRGSTDNVSVVFVQFYGWNVPKT